MNRSLGGSTQGMIARQAGYDVLNILVLREVAYHLPEGNHKYLRGLKREEQKRWAGCCAMTWTTPPFFKIPKKSGITLLELPLYESSSKVARLDGVITKREGQRKSPQAAF